MVSKILGPDTKQRYLTAPSPLIPWLFFLSGSAGLTFELIWTRQLSLALGCTVTSVALVSGVFLLCLGLGARWGKRLSYRPNLLRVFAHLELCIAVSGMVVVALLPYSPLAVALLTHLWGDSAAALTLARLLVCGLALSLPCLCMGASLPVLCALLSEQLGLAFLDSMSRLYAINTLGAVIGVLLCDGVFIPRLGIWKTGLLAACLDASVAALAGLLAGNLGRSSSTLPERPPDHVPGFRLGSLYFVCWGLGVAGTWLQVAWTRVLIVFQGSDLWAFSGCLATYLGSLALGSLALSRFSTTWERHGQSLLGVLWLASLSSLLSLACLPWARQLNNPWLANLLVIGPTGICLGVAFPLISYETKKHLTTVADCVGWALFFNTMGSLVGALLSAFLLIPMVGLQNTFGLASLGLALLAFLLRPRSLANLAVTLSVLGIVLATPSTYLRKLFFPQPDLHFLFTGDDSYGSVALVSQLDGTGQPVLQLLVDGFNMMSNGLPTQRYATALAAIPCLWQDHPDRVLVICLGLAHSVNTALRDPLTQRVDCVELSPTVVRALGTTPQGREALFHPKLNLIVSDGRQHLVSTSQRYQVITAEPPPPTRAGAVNLYTREFYQLCREHLEPGGIAVQWLPIFQMSRHQSQIIIKAFQEVFPSTYLVEGCGAQLCLIGTLQPIVLDYSALRRRVASLPALQATGWNDPELFLASILAGPKTLAEYTRTVAPLTDDWPVLQYSRENWDPDYATLLFGDPPQELEIRLSTDPVERASQQQEIDKGRRCFRGLRRFLCQDWVPTSQLGSIQPRGKIEREVLARMALRNYPRNAWVQAATQTTPAVQATLDTMLKAQPNQPDTLWLQAQIFFRGDQSEKAMAILQHPTLRDQPQAEAMRITILWESGQVEQAQKRLSATQGNLDPLDRDYLLRLLGTP